MTTTALIISTSNPPRGALEQKILKTGVFSQIVVCASGPEVISALGRQPVDLICWSAGLNDAADEWIDAVRVNPAWADLPLLVFTKEEDKSGRLRGLELGACDCLTFVTPTAELTARIQGHLKRSRQITHLRNRRAELAQMALNDPLTGLGNRTSFDLRLGQEISRSRRSGTSFGLMLIDLDHFKWFNDCYGHQAGDAILKAVARVLAETVRDSDIACRYGGEEFAIILPGTSATSAGILADRLHQAVATLSADLWQNDKALTASIGLTCFDGSRLTSTSELIGEADRALYKAKNRGRNRTETFLPAPSRLPLSYDYGLPEACSLQLH